MKRSTHSIFEPLAFSNILIFGAYTKPYNDPPQVLVTYGNRVLAAGSSSNPYAHKYKGIWVCLTVLARALSGNYVNFGVFDLYGDPALKVRTFGDWLQSARIASKQF